MNLKKWPEWANWVATDKSGDVYAYEAKPDLEGLGWRDGRCGKVRLIETNNETDPYWKQSLCQVKRINGSSETLHLGIDEQLVFLVPDVASKDDWIEWEGGEPPVRKGTLVDVKHRGGDLYMAVPAGKDYAEDWLHDGSCRDIVAYRHHPLEPGRIYDSESLADLPSDCAPDASAKKLTTAPDFLHRAAALMEERGKQYDQPSGERSMGKAVAAFNAITGRDLSEPEGWLLLQVLKDVRLFQRPGYHADSAEDCVAYAALKAEAKQNEAIYKSTTAETGN